MKHATKPDLISAENPLLVRPWYDPSSMVRPWYTRVAVTALLMGYTKLQVQNAAEVFQLPAARGGSIRGARCTQLTLGSDEAYEYDLATPLRL